LSSLADFQAAQAAHARGDYAKAERLYRGISRSMPSAAHNLGVVLMAQGKFKAAEEAFRAALDTEPGAPRPLFNLGQLRLAEGDYAAGWSLWENRRHVPGLLRQPPAVDAPEWDGSNLSGKRLLVAGEQGLGDHIMFARFIPELAARGAEVVFSAPAALHGALAELPATLIGQDQETRSGPYDAWVFMGCVPRLLGVTLDTLPPPAAIAAPPPQGAGGIGVMPTGGANNKNNAQRSLPPRYEQRLLSLGLDLRPEATGAASFSDTAAIVAGFDLVISVDTSVAHLAASMGKPTWILLQAAETDWRWLRGRSDSPWYPSARLFRQRVIGDWTPVFRQLEAAIADR